MFSKRIKKNKPTQQNKKPLSQVKEEKLAPLRPPSRVEQMTALITANKIQEAYHLLTEVKNKHPKKLLDVLKAMVKTLFKHKRLKQGQHFLKHVEKHYAAHLPKVLGYYGQGFIKDTHFKQAYAFIEHTQKYFPSQRNAVLNHIAYAIGLENLTPEIPHFLKMVKKSYPDRLENSLWAIGDGLITSKQAEGKFAFQFLKYVRENYPEFFAYVLKEMVCDFVLEAQFKQVYLLFMNLSEYDLTLEQRCRVASRAGYGAGAAQQKEMSKAYLFARFLKKDYPELLSLFFWGMGNRFVDENRLENITALLVEVRNYYPELLPDLLAVLIKVKNAREIPIDVPEEVVVQALMTTDDLRQRHRRAHKYLTFFDNTKAADNVFRQVANYHHLMGLYRLNYFQLQVFLRPEATTWLLYGANIRWPQGKCLPPVLVKSVAAFLLPMLPPQELSSASYRLAIRKEESKPVPRLLALQGLWGERYRQHQQDQDQAAQRIKIKQETSKTSSRSRYLNGMKLD